MGPLNNILMIGAIWLVTASFGTWFTMFRQPAELETLRKTEQNARILQSEVASLITEQSTMEGRAAVIQAQWDSRYKTIPKDLQTHEVIAYLNSLTQSGFENFDVKYDENLGGRDFNTHVFKVVGRGEHGALYDFIWSIENYRAFYRITDFELSHIDLTSVDKLTGRERMQVAVSFSFRLHAYYGGKAGLSADDTLDDPNGSARVIVPTSELPPVPHTVLPARDPAKNPFYPIILADVPPNSNGMLDLDTATLMSIVDGKAVFESSVRNPFDGSISTEFVTVGVGEDVYLGKIIMIDPIENRVIARLNLGGIMDEREFELETPPAFRQAIGATTLAPSN